MALTPARQAAAKVLLNKPPTTRPTALTKPTPPVKPISAKFNNPGMASKWGMGSAIPGTRFGRVTTKPKRTISRGPAVKRMLY